MAGAPLAPSQSKGCFETRGLAGVVAEDASSDFTAEGFAECLPQREVMRQIERFLDVGFGVFGCPIGMVDCGEKGQTHERGVAVADE